MTQDDVLAAEATLKIADTAKAAVPEIREKEAPEKEAPAPEEKPEEPGRRRVWQRVGARWKGISGPRSHRVYGGYGTGCVDNGLVQLKGSQRENTLKA